MRGHEALIARERLYGTLLGGGAGAFGGAAMLLVARAMLMHQRASLDPAVALGQKVHLGAVSPELVGLGLSMAIGTVLGAILGRSTWRVTRAIPRLVFFSILAPTLWLFAQVFLIGRLSPNSISAVPFVPFAVGSLAYAFFVAVVPATRRSKILEILPEK
ncbi:MAG TPA: hypothetical protein VHU80_18030 [Polyangiaceae bacterium]|nr:hypothetical protein [Polyangiaceae bacterium]